MIGRPDKTRIKATADRNHGLANAGDPATGRVGVANRRLVLRSAPECVLQCGAPVPVDVFAMFAVRHISGEYGDGHVVVLGGLLNVLFVCFVGVLFRTSEVMLGICGRRLIDACCNI